MPQRTPAACIGLAAIGLLVCASLANTSFAQRRTPMIGGIHEVHEPTGLRFQLPAGFTREESTDPNEKRQSYDASGRVFQIEVLPFHSDSLDKVLEGIRTEFSCAFRLDRLGRTGTYRFAVAARTEVAAPGFDDTDLADLVVMAGEEAVRLVIYASKGHADRAVSVANWISFTLRGPTEEGVDDALARREADSKTGLSWRAPRLMRRVVDNGVIAKWVSGDHTEISLRVSPAKRLRKALGLRGMRKSVKTLESEHGLELHRRARVTKHEVTTTDAFRAHDDGPYVILSIRRRPDDELARRTASLFIACLQPIELTRAELDAVSRSDRLRKAIKFEEGAAVERAVAKLAELGFMPPATDAFLELFLDLERDARAIAARSIRADTPERAKRVLTLLRHRTVSDEPDLQAALLGSLSTGANPDVLKWIAGKTKGAEPAVLNAIARLLANEPADKDRAVRLLINALGRLEKRAHKAPERIDADGSATAVRAALAHLTGLRFTDADAARAWLRSRPKD